MRTLRFLFSAAICAGLLACQTAKPLTFNDSAAVAYGAATAIIGSTDVLLKAGKINVATAANVLQQVNTLEAAIGIARQVEATNAADGANQLAAAATAITALSGYLTTLQPPGGAATTSGGK